MIKQPIGRTFAKPRISFWLSLLFLTAVARAEVPAPMTSTGAVTLQDCYQRARQMSETLGISAENIKVIEAQYKSALGSILPHLYWLKTQEFQDQSGFSGSQGAVANSFARSPIPQSNFQLQQPLFAGGKDWAALDIAKSAKEQARFNRTQADQQLLSDVAAAFYTALSWNDQLVVLTESHKLTEDRIKELQRYVDLGRSRPAEVLSAQTTLASLDAQIESIKQSYSDSRQLLLYLTGVAPEIPLVGDQGILQPPTTLDEAITRAGKRPDLLANVEALHQADLQVRYEKGGYMPSLSFLGNYYTERVGFLSDVRWDATFSLSVPLFEGLSTNAQVRQARSQQIIAQLTLARQKRDVDRQVRTAYNDFTLSQSQVQAYSKAVDLANRNYAVEQKEYRVGLINNLELLQLLADLQTVKQQAAIATAAARLNTILLRVAMGEGL
jgi:outer membrane protein